MIKSNVLFAIPDTVSQQLYLTLSNIIKIFIYSSWKTEITYMSCWVHRNDVRITHASFNNHILQKKMYDGIRIYSSRAWAGSPLLCGLWTLWVLLQLSIYIPITIDNLYVYSVPFIGWLQSINHRWGHLSQKDHVVNIP